MGYTLLKADIWNQIRCIFFEGGGGEGDHIRGSFHEQFMEKKEQYSNSECYNKPRQHKSTPVYQISHQEKFGNMPAWESNIQPSVYIADACSLIMTPG